jgi:hypothetical protein
MSSSLPRVDEIGESLLSSSPAIVFDDTPSSLLGVAKPPRNPFLDEALVAKRAAFEREEEAAIRAGTHPLVDQIMGSFRAWSGRCPPKYTDWHTYGHASKRGVALIQSLLSDACIRSTFNAARMVLTVELCEKVDKK